MMIERPADDTFQFLDVRRDFTEIHHDVTFAQSFTINIRLGFFHNMSETFQKSWPRFALPERIRDEHSF